MPLQTNQTFRTRRIFSFLVIATTSLLEGRFLPFLVVETTNYQLWNVLFSCRLSARKLFLFLRFFSSQNQFILQMVSVMSQLTPKNCSRSPTKSLSFPFLYSTLLQVLANEVIIQWKLEKEIEKLISIEKNENFHHFQLEWFLLKNQILNQASHLEVTVWLILHQKR